MKTWGIIGLGWLGKELSKSIEKNDDLFWGTHSGDFDFSQDSFPDQSCDILFLNTPPLTAMTPKAFVDKIVLQPNSKIMFISSTSVYGSNTGRLTEFDTPKPTSKNGHWLLTVETLLMQAFSKRLNIIRPGGLIGGQRHPINHLAGRSGIPDGNSVINLIHRIDLIKIIQKLSDEEQPLAILNAVAPAHPFKNDYYVEWANRLNLPIPQFDQTKTISRKIESEFLPKLYSNWSCPNLDFI